MEQNHIQTFAPLAFNLSIRTEATAPALARNAIDHAQMTTAPMLMALAASGVCAAVLVAVGLPSWLSIPLVVYPGYRLFKEVKPNFAAAHVERRIKASYEIVRKALDPLDVALFVEEVTAIVKSQHGSQAWAGAAQALFEKPDADPYMYLATVFANAPECWRLSARRVYDNLLAGVVPAPATAS